MMNNNTKKTSDIRDTKNNTPTETNQSTKEIINDQNKKIKNLELSIFETEKKIYDIKLRKLANIENIKKETKTKIQKIKHEDTEFFFHNIIPIVDILEDISLLSYKLKIHKIPIIEGIELTLKSLFNKLSKCGVIIEGNKNELFNPDVHKTANKKLFIQDKSKSTLKVYKPGLIFNKNILRKTEIKCF